MPVGVLGSDSFEAIDVDATTLAFGPHGAILAHRNGPHFEDVNGDGLLDRMLRLASAAARSKKRVFGSPITPEVTNPKGDPRQPGP